MVLGALVAPVVIVLALGLARLEVEWAPYAGVICGYASGVLAARYDLGVAKG